MPPAELVLLFGFTHKSHHVEEIRPWIVGNAVLVAICGKMFFGKDNVRMLGGTVVGIAVADEDDNVIGCRINENGVAFTRCGEAVAGFGRSGEFGIKALVAFVQFVY